MHFNAVSYREWDNGDGTLYCARGNHNLTAPQFQDEMMGSRSDCVETGWVMRGLIVDNMRNTDA